MKKGEKALLTVKPQYAFGEKGRPATTSEERDVVPPNASLQINLELVSWKTVSEVTNDRKVLKKTIKEGEGYQLPNDSAVVKDAMGLGKTVMTIALILARLGKGNQELAEDMAITQHSRNRRIKGGTLIVCPMALLGQWKDSG